MREFHPLVPRIADGLRTVWQDLEGVAPLAIEPELAEIRGELEGDAMAINNELLCCPGLRKIHLETAQVGRNLDILHCVLFPDPRYDLPLFGADIVAGRGAISAAIVDLSPTTGALTQEVSAALGARSRPQFKEPRDVPAWGAIFSPQVLFVRPTSAEEEEWFLQELLAFHSIFIAALKGAKPQPADHPDTLRRFESQLNYCQQQRRNDKTRRVLEMAFDPQWADNYIQNLLFDDPQHPGVDRGH